MKKIAIFVLFQKTILAIVFISLLLQNLHVYAQALPVAPAANFVVNRAVGGVITRVAISRGFAANDPRIAATLVGASSSLTAVNVASTVAGVGLAIAGAPVWLTVLAGLGIFAVGAAIVAGTSSFKLVNGSLQIDSGGGSAPPYVSPQNTVGDRYAQFAALGLQVYRDQSCLPSQYCYVYPLLPTGTIPYKWNPNIGDNSQGQAFVAFFSLQDLTSSFPIYGHRPGQAWTQVSSDFTESLVWNWVSPPSFEYSTNGTSRLVGAYNTVRTCISGTCSPITVSTNWDSTSAMIQIGATEGVRSYQDLNSAYPNISSAAKAQPLSAATVAQIADQAWKNAAAQPGYQGLPYSVTQPITASDVAAWQMENPSASPTIGDLFTPANNPGVNTVPISPAAAPNSAPNSNPNQVPDPNAIYNVNIVNTPRMDLGADPNIPAPTLETTPSAGEILVPLLTLFPELKNYQAPQHVGICPKAEFAIFEKTIVMDSHCTIAEQHRQALAAIMLTVWLLVGLFILLSA